MNRSIFRGKLLEKQTPAQARWNTFPKMRMPNRYKLLAHRVDTDLNPKLNHDGRTQVDRDHTSLPQLM